MVPFGGGPLRAAERVGGGSAGCGPRWSRGPGVAATVAAADLVYFSGGDPHYLEAALRDTPLWKAAGDVFARGGVLAGCSAGAMVLAEWLLQFGSGFHPSGWSPGLGLIPQSLVVPHFDYRGFDIAVSIGPLRRRLPDEVTIVGVDEHTALVGRPGEAWEVLGRSSVTLWRRDGRERFESGQVVPWWGTSC
ncbi:MAG: Type 1 glutamine amidotransferase-like domain-containing protein [Ardenticatenaceae bacterium]|nr:Type 1 glutamine amidotransferase-like domain-containing protein [Ardenticatenaceae bacterium]